MALNPALDEWQAEPMAALEAAVARAGEVVDPDLLALAQQRIDAILLGVPVPEEDGDDRQSDVAALIDQMLLDVSGVDDGTAQRAGRHFAPGGLSDLVTASYLLEARTRLRIAGDRLLGGTS